jgi:predicted DNA-binding transcriptional regulator AlpA
MASYSGKGRGAIRKDGNVRAPTGSEEAPPPVRTIHRLATLGDVAAFLQVPSKTLYLWRSMGKGPPALKVGRHLRYRWTDVEAWLETRADGKSGLR